jgi:hypothetical protein
MVRQEIHEIYQNRLLEYTYSNSIIFHVKYIRNYAYIYTVILASVFSITICQLEKSMQ